MLVNNMATSSKEQEANSHPEAGIGGDVEAPPDYGTLHGNPNNEDKLPTYQQALHDPTGPPPSYDSVFGKVKDAKEESSNVMVFVMRTMEIIIGTMCFTLVLGILLAVPVSMVAMGAIHLSNCPAERYIPIYLIVAGAMGILRSLISLVTRFTSKQQQEEERQEMTAKKLLQTFHCILFAWFIAGNVWIYKLYGHFNGSDETASNYCNPTLYYFAFWITTSTYILIGTMCFCICCGSCVAFFVS